MRRIPCIAALLLVSCILVITVSSSEVVLTTTVGKIAGKQKEKNVIGRMVNMTEFFGIPYAEDTSGKNRFRRPIPKAPFNYTFKAFTLSPPCMQLTTLIADNKDMTEDCLMLNIFVPRSFHGSDTEKLPVMIWIHGGAFVSGSARGYDGTILSVVGDIVFVTINYRLAEFGFLNVGDGRAQGNQGLWDQHLAFKWVKQNINAFHGDPENITIFGESAGAGSVAFHSLYAGNRGLFTRVIAESGSALAYWATHEITGVNPLYEAAGCDKGPQDPVDCLRQLSSADFMQVLRKPGISVTGCCSNAPTIDGEFIVEKPVEIAFGNHSKSANAREFFHSLDMIMGVNNGEGGLIVLTEWLRQLQQRHLDNMTVTVTDIRNIVAPYMINEVLKPLNNKSLDALKAAIEFEYVDWKYPNDNDLLRQNLYQLSSDVAFFVPAVQTMIAHSSASRGRSYLYEFSVEPPMRPLPTPKWFRGANHADEIQYVFGIPFWNISVVQTFHYVLTPRNEGFTQADQSVSMAMMTAWTNFAKTGNPNIPSDVSQYINTTWPQYEHIHQRYLDFSLNMIAASSKNYFSARAVAFWTKLLPTIVTDSLL